MWAMMPMLRIWSSGVVRGILPFRGRSMLRPYLQQKRGATVTPITGAGLAPLSSGGASPLRRVCLCSPRGMARVNPPLPPIVRECPVGLGHSVRVFFLLYGLALALRGEDQLGGQPLRHVLLAPGAAERDQPAHAKRRAPLGPHFHRYLIRRTADAARLHLERRLHVRERLLEHVHPGLPGALLDQVHRRVEHPLRQRLLVLLHQVIEKLGDGLAVVARVGGDGPAHRFLSAAHDAAGLGRLAPYLERDCLRSFTPAASSVPRMIW